MPNEAKQPEQRCGTITIEQKATVEGQAVAFFIETGLTPRQLAEQREELREALGGTLSWLSSYPGEGANNAWDEARAALAKAEGETK